MGKNFVSNADAQALMQAIEEKKLTVSDTMPAASPDLLGNTRLYIGSDTASLQKGGVYQCQALQVTPAGSEDPSSEGWYVYNSVSQEYELTTDTSVVAGTTYYTIEWKNISRAEVDLSHYKKIWGGSTAAWEQLTDAQKEEYDYEFFDDDQSDYSLEITDAVTKGDMHPVTSNAVSEADEDIDAEISDIVNIYGSKNLLPCTLDNVKSLNTGGTWNDNVYTIAGVTFTVNTDEANNIASITVNGTNNGGSRVSFNMTPIFETLSGETYIASCEGFSGSNTIYVDFAEFSGTTWKADHLLKTTEEIEFTTAWPRLRANYFIENGATVDNNTFKPMLRLASIKDNTWVPYAMTNHEMTKRLVVHEKTYTGLTTEEGYGYILADIPSDANVLSILPSNNSVWVPYRNAVGASNRWVAYLVKKFDTASSVSITVYYTEEGGMP